MAVHPLAGKPAPRDRLVNVPRLVSAYYAFEPDPRSREQRVSFGTSGHRGSSFSAAFNEQHILAITQAICEYRQQQGVDGPLFLGVDPHALSEPARITALEVLAANGVSVCIDERDGYTPTPVISRAILQHNHGRDSGLADGIVITPSHNPPEDGGFKYNPPHGGPADSAVTAAIEARANAVIEGGCREVRRIPYARALSAATTRRFDFLTPYVAGLAEAIDFEPIRSAGVKIGVDPLGGSAVAYFEPIADRYGIDLTLVNRLVDPTFAFMTLDKDGKIRMDCSSRYAMASLIALKDGYDVAVGNDADADRHGVVTRGAGLMNPNHFLAVASDYLFRHRPGWPAQAALGKTLVTSSLLDRVATGLGRRLGEVPVGFKWFVSGLLDGSLGFGGEESAGAAFLRRDGSVWTTDKDGILLDLLAAEITAVSGRDPAELYRELTARYGDPVYRRIDAPASAEQRAILKRLSPAQVTAGTLGGERIEAVLTQAPGNQAAIGGIKVVAKNGWFAARPSGTEDVYKIYAESFLGAEHLAAIQTEAQHIVDAALASA